MKSYVIGAIAIWLLCGIVGAWPLGEQQLHLRTIAGGPIALWRGLNKPVDE